MTDDYYTAFPLPPKLTLTPQQRQANQQACQSFLSRLFAPYCGQGYLDMRAIWPQWMQQYQQCPGSDEEWNPTRGIQFLPLRYAPAVASEILVNQSVDSDVFYGVLPRARQSGKMTSVELAAWLWADIDMKHGGPNGARALLSACLGGTTPGSEGAGTKYLPKPTLAVETRSGLHLYWQIEQVKLQSDHERRVYASVLKSLADWIGRDSFGGADAAVTNVNAVLRPPGTFNHKAEGSPVQITELNVKNPAPVRTLRWWQDNIPGWSMPVEYQPRAAVKTDTRYRMTKAAEQLLADPPPGERHATLRKILSGAVYYGQQIGELELIATEFADKTGLPKTEAVRLARHFAKL